MPNLLQRLRAALFGERTPPAGNHGRRQFDAAVLDRLTSSWARGTAAIDQELRGQLDRLRDRSRDLAKNNEYAKKFLRMVRNNVAGPEGFALQARAVGANGKLDTADNQAIERAFWRWQRPSNCDVTGRRSFADLTRAVVTALARDGEFLIREVRDPRGAGEFGYQLQLLDVARLDTTYNRAATQGVNAIRMGVEVDSVGRPVYYHILTSPPGVFDRQPRERERVPAGEIIHQFIPLEEEDSRGTPWMHAAMRRLNDLGGYREAAVIAARVGAAKMGIWETPDGEPPPNDGEQPGAPGSYVTDATPGHFDFAPPGYKLHTYDPAYPHEQFDAFNKATLRGIASALGVAYNGLANDLEGVNFSSIRSGVLEERDEWMVIQNWLTTAFLVRVYEGFLDMALLRSAIRLPSGTPLPATKREKFLEHYWQGRRWQWVDPKKDIEAAGLALDRRLTSPQQIAAQTGRDIEEVLDDWVAFEEMCAARGIRVPSSAAPPTAPAVVDDQDD